ncbi:MAG TPA: cell division protein ZapA [Beijerinckiaceae bacterium]|nr:cell division protein ZapA [Beijerinckiaceae bacterium]
MAQVTVTIAGRVYRMACGDGEEAHLEAMARSVDEKIAEMRTTFGEIGDQRLIVMSAITFADELAETQRKLMMMKTDLERARAEIQDGRERGAVWAEGIAEGLDQATERIERLARSMNAAGKE